MKKLWIYILSIFIGLSFCQNIIGRVNFNLTNFSGRTIGTAVLNGEDISNRSLFYYILITIFCICYFVCVFILKKIRTKNTSNNNNILFTLSTSAIFLQIYHYVNGAEVFVDALNILKYLILLSLITLIIRKMLQSRDKVFYNILGKYNLTILNILLPLVFFFTRWSFTNGDFTFNKHFFIIYLFIWVGLWIVERVYYKFENSILKSAIPLLLIPISIPLSNEIQYSLSNILWITQRRVSIVTILGLIVTSLLIFITNKNTNVKFKFTKYIYLPIFISTLTLFSFHTNFLDIKFLDTFHHGENLISTQQFFEHGAKPFANIYPTHGISYMISQIIYSLLNGYTPFSPWLFEWITKLFEMLLLYFVLTKITNSFFSSINISFIPLLGIFGGQQFIYGYTKSIPNTYYFASFLVGLVLVWVIKKPSFVKFILLWLSCMFLTLWRVDFGIAGYISSIFIALIITKRIKQLVSSLTITSLIGLLLFCVFSRLNFTSFNQILIQIIQFIKFQGQAQGLPTIIANYSPIAIFQYLLLPSIGVIYIIYFVARNKNIPSYKSLLIYIAIFSVIISIRSFQRQTLAVLGYNPYLFVFLLVTLPIFISAKKNQQSLLFFTLGLLVYQLILPNGAVLLKHGQQISLYNWQNKQNRVQISDNSTEKITDFLTKNLDNNQTFIDLTSSPLLYITTKKRFINYFIPNAYNTSDVIQSFSLEKIQHEFKDGNIPILLFRQSLSDADNIDGVPNEIRSYRIYEFVYRNYHPVGYIDKYFVWIANDHTLQDQSNIVRNVSFDQKFNLQKLPFIWAQYDPNNAIANTRVLETLVDNKIQLNKPIDINISKNIDKTSGNYLHLIIKGNQTGIVTIDYGENKNTQFIFDLIQSNKPEDYLIRLSSQYNWSNDYISKIKISTGVPIEIDKIFIRKGD